MRPATPPGPIPAIGYIRVSTWFEEKISDEIQKTAILDAAARRGRRIVAWVTDLDESGRHFKRRIMQAIEAVETGAFEQAREIWVWKFSRFGRNRHGVAINMARVEQVGGELVSATEEVDARTAVGRFTRGMLFELAAFESDRAGEQWRETHTYRREHGLPATGRPRFGYLWTPRKAPDGTLQQESYDPDPATHRDLGTMYEMYAGGSGFHTIADWLAGKGHRTTRGNPWSVTSLNQYMDSGFAAGLLHVHQPEEPCGTPSGCGKRGHYTHIPAAHTAVIGDDLWDAYQQRRDEVRRLPPRARYATYPLTGLVKCGRCEGPGAIQSHRGQRGYGYRCARAMNRYNDCGGFWTRRVIVEDAVREWLLRMREEVDAIVAGRVVEPPAPAPDLSVERQRKQLRQKIARLAAGLDTAAEALALGDIPRDSYLRTRDKLLGQKAAAEAELAVLPGEESPTRRAPSLMDLRQVVEGLVEEWDTLPVAALRDLLGKAVREVRVSSSPGGVVVDVVPRWAAVP